MKKFHFVFVLIIICVSAFSQVPTITSFTPASGPVGTLVTITGNNLSSPTAFTIGGVSAILVSGGSDSIVGMVMPGAVAGVVSITTAGGNVTSASNFSISPTLYPSTQQSSKLVGTGAVGFSQQGQSIAISADGNTAIVGGPYDNNDTGAAWIYIRSGSSWTQQGSKLVGAGAAGAALQGWSVALSADGNTAAIGGYGDNYTTGAVWVFSRTGSNWVQQGAKLVGSGAMGTMPAQGQSVALSADGNTAVIGAPWDSSNIGAIWIFTRSGSIWSQQGPKLIGTGAVTNTNFGWSAAISADGNTAIVGGPGSYVGGNSSQFNDTGAVWVFIRSGGIWSQQGPQLRGAAGAKNAGEGTSVAISADGNTIIEGGPGDSTNAADGGTAWIFTRSGSLWSQQGNKLIGTGAINGFQGAQQGRSVGLSADGNMAIIGGAGDTYNAGAVWTYTRSGGNWAQQGSKLLGTGGAGGLVLQGWSAALSADGNTVIEGGMQDNNGRGAAWVFATACTPDSSTSYDTICTSALPFMWNGQTFTQASTHTAILTNVGSCDSVVTLTLTVNPLPVVSLSWDSLVLEGDIVAIGNGLDTISCQYSPRIYLMRGGNPLGGIYTGSTIQNDTMNLNLFNFSNPQDTVFYTYTSSNGCTNSAVRYLDVGICVNGILEINSTTSIHLYPNPNKGSFTLQTSNSIGSEYTISDMLGHVIMQQTIRFDNEVLELPDAAEGVYTLSLAGSQPIRFLVMR